MKRCALLAAALAAASQAAEVPRHSEFRDFYDKLTGDRQLVVRIYASDVTDDGAGDLILLSCRHGTVRFSIKSSTHVPLDNNDPGISVNLDFDGIAAYDDGLTWSGDRAMTEGSRARRILDGLAHNNRVTTKVGRGDPRTFDLSGPVHVDVTTFRESVRCVGCRRGRRSRGHHSLSALAEGRPMRVPPSHTRLGFAWPTLSAPIWPAPRWAKCRTIP